jgi:hypothetical protein
MTVINFICDHTVSLISYKLSCGSLTYDFCTLIQVILLNLVGFEIYHMIGNPVETKLPILNLVDIQDGLLVLKLAE